MTAVDRDYALRVLNTARDTQENRATLFAEKDATDLKLQAETRSYSIALLTDAITNGLLEQLHAEAEQLLFLDSVVADTAEVAADDEAWFAYLAGHGPSPLPPTAPAGPVAPDASEFVAQEHVGPTGIGSSTPGGML